MSVCVNSELLDFIRKEDDKFWPIIKPQYQNLVGIIHSGDGSLGVSNTSKVFEIVRKRSIGYANPTTRNQPQVQIKFLRVPYLQDSKLIRSLEEAWGDRIRDFSISSKVQLNSDIIQRYSSSFNSQKPRHQFCAPNIELPQMREYLDSTLKMLYPEFILPELFVIR